MKKLFVLIAFLLAAPSPTEARDPWSRTDTALETTFVLLTAADWQQTRYFLTHTDYAEANPILGEHPSLTKLDVGVGLAVVGHAAVAYLIPDSDLRHIWQMVWISVEGVAVFAVNGPRVGLKIHF
jgi:hypothetical protein